MHAVFQLADCCLRKPGSQCEAGKLNLFYLEGTFRKNYSILPTSWGRLIVILDKGGGLLCHGFAVSNKRLTKIERSRRNMKAPIIKKYVAEVEYRGFPKITISVELNSDGTYTAQTDQEFWGPGNPIKPYRHLGTPKATTGEAIRDALNTFNSQDNVTYSNDEVFVTGAHEKYEEADFFDGNGKKVSYDDVIKIISQHKESR